MKKLLLAAAFVTSSIIGTMAQTTILYQAFSTSIPTGWTQQISTIDGGWRFGTAFGTNMQSNVHPQGDDAYIDAYDYNLSDTKGWDTLKTIGIDCSAQSAVLISLNYTFWVDDGNETATIIVSTDGGVTWHKAANLSNTTNTWVDSTVFNLSAYAAGQSNVMVGFTYYNGYPGNGYAAVGLAIENVDIYSPANYNVQVKSQNTPYFLQVGTPYTFSGVAANQGGDAITSMNMNYSVNHGTPVSQAISGITGFNALTNYSWSMNNTPSQFIPSSIGIDTIRFWASNLNGNPNVNTDTLVASFLVADSVKARAPLEEEYTGQSCVFCMVAAPNVDSVSTKNVLRSNIIRYHFPASGRDFMYNTTSSFVNTRVSYYSVPGGPAGYLDGTTLYPSTYQQSNPRLRYSSTTVQADQAVGSPIKIDITSSTYDAVKDSFYVSANITSYAPFNAGLKVQIALTIDSLYYYDDLSQDDPQKSFAPPIGKGVTGYSYQNAPDYYYPYVLRFPHVVEEMLPNANGTSLTAFTAGQTQTVSYGWKKNHSWGQYANGGGISGGKHLLDSTKYDSSSTGQFVVFVQANSAFGTGIPAKYVLQSASAPITGITALGLQQIAANGASFELYPNPTNNTTNLVFKLEQDQNVTVEVYNMLGEAVYATNAGMMSAEQHIISINGSNFRNGIYFVRFNTDNSTSTQKLVIQR